LEPEFYI